MSKKKEPGEDFIILGPPTEDGNGVSFLRHRKDHSWVSGIFHPLEKMEEGKPMHGELVCLEKRDNGTYSISPAEDNGSKSGPAMVNNKAFRDGWDGIFGKKIPVGEA